MILTDKYAPEYGFRVEVDNGVVEIIEAHYIEEEDITIVIETNALLRELLIGKHRGTYGGDNPPFKSQKDKVISAAISYIGYWGGEEKIMEGYRLPDLFAERLF